MLYFSYGSNLHKEQMNERCPDSFHIKKLIIQDFKLLYRNGVATIEFKKESTVAGAIYGISESDELALDRYEGFPKYYTKKFFKYRGELIMFYTLPSYKAKISMPSMRYFNTIEQGYKDWGLPLVNLYDSLLYTKKLLKNT